MSHTMKLRYAQFLLDQMRQQIWKRDTSRALSLADRWERVMASIPREPLVWEGDNA